MNHTNNQQHYARRKYDTFIYKARSAAVAENADRTTFVYGAKGLKFE